MSALRVARQVLSGAWTGLAVLGVMSVLSGLAQVVVLLVIVRSALALSEGEEVVVLDVGPLPEARVELSFALVGAGACVLALLVVARVTARQASSIASRVLARERGDLLAAFLRARPGVQRSGGAGAFQELASAYTSRAAQVASATSSTVVGGLNLLVLLIGAFLVDVVAAGALLVGVACLSLLTQPLALQRRRAARDQAVAGLEYAELLGETIASAREVRLFGVVEHVDALVQERIAQAAAPYARVLLLNRFTPTAFQYAGFGLLLIGLAVLAQGDPARLGALGSVMLIVLRSFTYAQALQTALQQVSEAVPYCERLQGEKERLQSAADVHGVRGAALDRVDELALQDVGLVHADGRVALQGIDLRVLRGAAVGLVGPSGSGKSTLAQVLLRLLEPTSGRYLVNGQAAATHDLRAWYRLAALVPQDPVLVRGTIGANIRFYRPLGDDAVERAARAAGIHDEVVALPAGYDTRLEHSGSGLSGGQRQRIAIARALAGEPELLVLDEPTSALDRSSADVVVATLARLKGSITLVVISHQAATVAFCDRVVHLEGGRVRRVEVPRLAAAP